MENTLVLLTVGVVSFLVMQARVAVVVLVNRTVTDKTPMASDRKGKTPVSYVRWEVENN